MGEKTCPLRNGQPCSETCAWNDWLYGCVVVGIMEKLDYIEKDLRD